MPVTTRDGPNTIRILVATDNHVGYEERDPIRKDDSWKTFDEILMIAKEREVDMVLLGGDLFHENRPSRKSMYQVMRSLRKHCLGMRPCELEFLSDANEVFEGAFPHVNYEDPDINISLPVFSIHGNHDDPGGEGNYCSLDLLQVSGLVNYFGRVPEVDNIHVKPVILQKGETKLALYGISNVRDERLFRTFKEKKVTFYRPPETAGDFFNLLTVHQNHSAHTSTTYLPEHVLPKWMNLVIWGHEHDCQIEPQENPDTGFFVMQPGSSIATSLTAGEAETKHVAILSITGDQFQSETIPLKTVRPFVIREISLKNEAAFKKVQHKKDNREVVAKELMKIVNEMIEEAKRDWLSMQDNAQDIDEEDQPLPLIRLKVEHSADEGGHFDVENPQRFSNRFVGKVANVNDVVSFYRKRVATKLAKNPTEIPDTVKEALENDDVIRIDVLVREFLQNSSLKVLPQNQFEEAVIEYIERGGKEAVDEFVNETLAKSLKYLVKVDDTDLDNDLQGIVDKCRERLQQRWVEQGGKPWVQKRKLKPRPEFYDSDLEGPWDDPDNPERWESITEAATAKAKGRGRARNNSDDEDVDMDAESNMFMTQPMEEDDPFAESPPRPAPKRGAAAKSTRGATAKKTTAAKKPPATRSRPQKKAAGFVVDSDDEEEEQDQDDGQSVDAFIDDEDDEPPPPPPPKRAARATKSATTKASTSKALTSMAKKAAPAKGKQTTLNFSQSQRSNTSRVNPTQKTLEISDDEIDDDDDAFEPVQPSRSSRRR